MPKTYADKELLRLYTKKQRLQSLEQELADKRKLWQELGEQVRSLAQQRYEMREALINSIKRP